MENKNIMISWSCFDGQLIFCLYHYGFVPMVNWYIIFYKPGMFIHVGLFCPEIDQIYHFCHSNNRTKLFK